ncbi:MAG: hypothetical protein BWK78_06380 [Thiotrichaceae bacterium IS1]|nr:MAG: hypothetical protein BWK78_06380 [Thiotrichaceae bacterium IS1]
MYSIQLEWYVLATLLLLLLSVILGRNLWWWYRAQRFLERKNISKIPDLKSLLVKEGVEKNKIFPAVKLLRTAQQLRKHQSIPSNNQLDVKATVEKTIRAAGWFTPVFGTVKQLPEYLVLIDRTTFRDHQAELVKTLISQLIIEEVPITYYFFDADPRRCYPEQPQQRPLTLPELAGLYSDYHLLIFADGSGFINPITGELATWVDQFSNWSQRVLFTLEHPQQWGFREQLLEENADFLILPANEEGLTALVEQFNLGDRKLENEEPFPEMLIDRPRRYLERHAPDVKAMTELLAQVRRFLGEAGYDWFNACAVYPELFWELTVYLGDKLNVLTADRLGKLARLPWFRYGYMPNWLREKLREDLPWPKEVKICEEINLFLMKAIWDDASQGLHLTIAEKQKSTLLALAPWVLPLLAKRSKKSSPFYEYVFLTSNKTRTAIPVPKELLEKLLVPISISDILQKLRGVVDASFSHIIIPSSIQLAKRLWGWLKTLWDLLLFVYKVLSFIVLNPLTVMNEVWVFTFVCVLFVIKKLFSYDEVTFASLYDFYRLRLKFNRFRLNPFRTSYFYRRLLSNLVVGLTTSLLLIVFHDTPVLKNLEDIATDWTMQIYQQVIPSRQERGIPPFVLLNIDDETYQSWNEPLIPPRNRLKNLIAAAVEAKARLVIVDIDLSRESLVEGLLLPNGFQRHPYDQELDDYLRHYATNCRGREEVCPPIILTRSIKAADAAVPTIRPTFLDEVVAQSVPYIQWGARLFYYLPSDHVVRRSVLWQPVCVKDQPGIIPSVELLVAALIRNGVRQGRELIRNSLERFKPNCRDNFSKNQFLPEDIIFIGDLIMTLKEPQQRIMYSMPWLAENKTSNLSFLSDQRREPISTIIPAHYYSEANITASLEVFENQIVVIGGSYRDGRDIYLTPIGDMPGSLILINAIHSLLYNIIVLPAIGFTFGLEIFLIMLMSIVLMWSRTFWGMLLSGVMVIFLLLPMSIVSFRYGVWVNFIIPLVSVLLSHIGAEFNMRVVESENYRHNKETMINREE